jgi:ribose-phosphate pyrophosphokinase
VKSEPIIIGNTSDNPFAIDIAYYCGQKMDISDIVGLNDFQNTEFCPRFISDEFDMTNIGDHLEGQEVIIVSTSSSMESRNSLAMRNLILARAAKDNGANYVTLLEPDLFYSCQDRGPRKRHTYFDEVRKFEQRKKFDGQPFTALLYAQLLKQAGVDRVMTVHNHSLSTQAIFKEFFSNMLTNIIPSEIYAKYMKESDIVDVDNLILCAPDKGAREFVDCVNEDMGGELPILYMDKERSGERKIDMELSDKSDLSIKDVEGKDVVVFDDMIRTGTTIVKCCEMIKQYKPNKIVFCVTHFHSSDEGRAKLASPAIDEIITTNTIPSILNRDTQGRLRKKIVVLKLERFIAKKIAEEFEISNKEHISNDKLFSVDMSAKNPRWREK